MEPLTDCLPAFGRHRGYPPRHGWMRKVHLALQDDPHTLQRPDATVTLGVGASMIPAMRFWTHAFGLASALPTGGLAPTDRGLWLLDDERGADPFLEEASSLFLLHWWLLSATPCHVPSWRCLFGHAGLRNYSRQALHKTITDAAEKTGWKPPAPAIVTRDIACLVSMYAPKNPEQPQEGIEDSLTNPFRSLHLLTSSKDRTIWNDRTHTLTINRTAGATCPPGILAHASLDYASRRNGPAPGNISIARLASAPDGPGRLLLTDTDSLLSALRTASHQHEALSVTESATGEQQLVYAAAPALLARNMLAAAFPRAGGV